MDIGKIEKGSIQIVGREGNRVYLQCLKKDIINLPKQEILSGSSCFVLDALDTENCLYVYNKLKNEEGQWYPLWKGELNASNVVTNIWCFTEKN